MVPPERERRRDPDPQPVNWQELAVRFPTLDFVEAEEGVTEVIVISDTSRPVRATKPRSNRPPS
jgi:hypothetical protein